MNTRLKKTSLILIAISFLSACTIGNRIAQHGESVSTTLGNITVNDNNIAGDLSITNGNITLGDNARANTIEVVNGNIDLGELSQAKSLETINGNIFVSEKVKVLGDVKTINGNIDVKANSSIVGSITTHSGNITLAKNSKVFGNITFEQQHKLLANVDNEQPKLFIEDGALIEGYIHLYQAVTIISVDKNLLEKVLYHYKDNLM